MKKIFITIALLTFPLFAAAQANQEQNGVAIEAQIFTACSQEAIEVRDSSISAARTAYNHAMAIALGSRKDAEKKAVAITDNDEKKAAIKGVVEEYKKVVNHAQESLIKARKEAWAQFEISTSKCREASRENKASVLDTKADARASLKADDKKGESLKDVVIGAIKNLFKKAE